MQIIYNIPNLQNIQTPCYILERDKLKKNLEIIAHIQKESGAKILLALKGYAFWRCFEDVKDIMAGSTASGAFEARLGFEEIGGIAQGKDVCIFNPAYKEIDSILPFASHIIFNSFAQFSKFAPKVKKYKLSTKHKISLGLRINPLYSEVTPLIYNPCAPHSRLGITPDEFHKGIARLDASKLKEIEGLHFHTHCEQDCAALARTLSHVIKHFGIYFKNLKWINFGGGHHITRKDYDVGQLIKLIRDFKEKFRVEVILEPGEAIGWHTGFLLASVLDIIKNKGRIAILDTSFSAHMPDCLEMPYIPSVVKIDSALKEERASQKKGKFSYYFGGNTCLAGDMMGKFNFDSELKVGDRLLFEDMLHYTIVKNNTFNGIPLPSLGVIEGGTFRLLKEFNYIDYKERN